MPQSGTIFSFFFFFWLKHTKTQPVSGSVHLNVVFVVVVSSSVNLVVTLPPTDNIGYHLSVLLLKCFIIVKME